MRLWSCAVLRNACFLSGAPTAVSVQRVWGRVRDPYFPQPSPTDYFVRPTDGYTSARLPTGRRASGVAVYLTHRLLPGQPTVCLPSVFSRKGFQPLHGAQIPASRRVHLEPGANFMSKPPNAIPHSHFQPQANRALHCQLLFDFYQFLLHII